MSLRIAQSEPKGQWTNDQWQAIYTQGTHLLVAAAAGAGKTAVLVERIIQRLLDPVNPCDVDRLLVVTFTEAAAAQMRERIAKALNEAAEDERRPTEERTRLRRQLTLLDRAPIQTLHGFCHWLLRRYFYLLDVDPLFRVLDGEEAILLQYETMDRLLEAEYDRHEPDAPFYQLIDAYRDARGDSGIRSTLLALHAYAASLPDPDAWFAASLEAYDVDEAADIDSLPWTEFVVGAIEKELFAAKALLHQALGRAEASGAPATVQTILTEEIGFVGELIGLAGSRSWRKLQVHFSPPPKFKTMRFPDFEDDLAKAQIQAARNKAKDVLSGIAKTYFRHSEEVELTLLRETRPHVAELIRLVQEFDARYRKVKQSRAVVDFSDLERLALQILETRSSDEDVTDPRDELRALFMEVLVDEYQDINPLQDAILRSVSRPPGSEDPNLFMVGDVKQSIYRFRLADPTLFMDRMHNFSPLEQVTSGEVKSNPADGVVIDLKENFRSRTEVIDGVNFVFRQILTPGVGELAYDKRAELVAGAAYPPEGARAVELHVVEREPDRVPASGESGADSDSQEERDGATTEHRSALENEAMVVADLIAEMIERGDQVYDRDAGCMRPVRYRDVAILLRSTKGRANVFVEALRLRGIPAYAQLGTGFFWAVEVETMLAVLRIIDNPRQDIPLAAALRAPWIDLSTADLARIRTFAPRGDFYDAVTRAAEQLEGALGERLRQFLGQLDAWRTLARLAPLGELIQQIYNDTGFTEYVQGMPGGAQRLVNLHALLERAGRFDGFTQGGLSRFLRFVDSLQEEEGDLGEAPLLGEGDDVVRIMSIHKSKGLQFPVVISADLGKGFNLSDRHGSILYQGDLGIALQWSDPELGLRSKTLAHHAVSEVRRQEAIAEELRVLYVALTRAQERLIMVGSVPDVWATAARWSQVVEGKDWPLPDYFLARAKNPLDWIGPSVMRHQDGLALRSVAERETGETVSLPDGEVLRDPSTWSVKIWGDEDLTGLANVEGKEVSGASDVPWDLLAAGQPLGRSVNPMVAEKLGKALGQTYRFQPSTEQAAKMSVTLLARDMVVAANEESQTFSVGGRPGPHMEPFTTQLRKPLFIEEERVPTAAEQGTAMHTLLYHLDLNTIPTREDIVQTIHELTRRHLITEAQSEVIDVGAVQDFFSTDLGERLVRASRAGQMWREWSFMLGIDANKLQAMRGNGQQDAAWQSDDVVIVQGTVDVLWREDDHLFLLDYKTDRAGGETILIERYKPQIQMYTRAINRITQKKPSAAYLVHLRSKANVYRVDV